MLIPVWQLRRIWGLRPEVVLHVGAHNGEESDDYMSNGWGSESTVWVEADAEKASALMNRLEPFPQHKVVCGVAWDQADESVVFHILSNSQASSVLPPAELLNVYEDISEVESVTLVTTTLDRIATNECLDRIDLINLDIQGAELRAIRGLGQRLQSVGAVYSEFNTRELYADVPLLEELDAFLTGNGFARVDLAMASASAGWGDALWIRRELVPRARGLRHFLRRAVGVAGLAYYRLRLTGHWCLQRLGLRPV